MNPSKSSRIRTNPEKDKAHYGALRQALEATITALELEGRLANIDEARIAIARQLATLLDSNPDSPILWREYRTAEKALRDESVQAADPFEKLLEQLSAPIRNEKKSEETDSRT